MAAPRNISSLMAASTACSRSGSAMPSALQLRRRAIPASSATSSTMMAPTVTRTHRMGRRTHSMCATVLSAIAQLLPGHARQPAVGKALLDAVAQRADGLDDPRRVQRAHGLRAGGSMGGAGGGAEAGAGGGGGGWMTSVMADRRDGRADRRTHRTIGARTAGRQRRRG